MRRQQRFAKNMALVCHFFMAFLSLGLLILVLGSLIWPEFLGELIRQRYDKVSGAMTLWQTLTIVSLLVLGIFLLIQMVRSLGKMYNFLASSEPLGRPAAEWMRKAGLWLLAFSVYSVVVEIPLSLTASALNPPGERFINLQFGLMHFSSLFGALVFLSVAHVQNLAADLHEENKQII